MRAGHVARIELAACKIRFGVAGAFYDRTDGESDVVEFGVGGVELTFRSDAAREIRLETARALIHVNGYRSGAS